MIVTNLKLATYLTTLKPFKTHKPTKTFQRKHNIIKREQSIPQPL